MSVGIRQCLSEWTLDDVAFKVGAGNKRIFGLPANEEDFKNEICVGGNFHTKNPMNYMKRMRRLAVKLSRPELLVLKGGNKIELVESANVQLRQANAERPKGASVAKGLTAIARGRFKPSLCSENDKNYVRYFLKFKVGAGNNDTWLAGEDNAYDCDVFNFDLPFFIFPLRIGEVRIPRKLGAYESGTYHGLMLEDASMREPEQLPGLEVLGDVEVNTISNLMNLYDASEINGTFIDGFVIQMFAALETMTQKGRSHGDLHWYNMFMTPIHHLFQNSPGAAMQFSLKYDGTTVPEPLSLKRNTSTEPVISLNGLLKIFDWDQGDPFYTMYKKTQYVTMHAKCKKSITVLADIEKEDLLEALRRKNVTVNMEMYEFTNDGYKKLVYEEQLEAMYFGEQGAFDVLEGEIPGDKIKKNGKYEVSVRVSDPTFDTESFALRINVENDNVYHSSDASFFFIEKDNENSAGYEIAQTSAYLKWEEKGKLEIEHVAASDAIKRQYVDTLAALRCVKFYCRKYWDEFMQYSINKNPSDKEEYRNFDIFLINSAAGVDDKKEDEEDKPEEMIFQIENYDDYKKAKDSFKDAYANIQSVFYKDPTLKDPEGPSGIPSADSITYQAEEIEEIEDDVVYVWVNSGYPKEDDNCVLHFKQDGVYKTEMPYELMKREKLLNENIPNREKVLEYVKSLNNPRKIKFKVHGFFQPIKMQYTAKTVRFAAKSVQIFCTNINTSTIGVMLQAMYEFALQNIREAQENEDRPDPKKVNPKKITFPIKMSYGIKEEILSTEERFVSGQNLGKRRFVPEEMRGRINMEEKDKEDEDDEDDEDDNEEDEDDKDIEVVVIDDSSEEDSDDDDYKLSSYHAKKFKASNASNPFRTKK